MVVVPTSKHVKLTFATSSVEWAGRFLTLVALAGLGGLVWWGLARRSTPDPESPDSAVGSPRRRVRFPSRSPR
jgi:hypothetical protein